MPPPTLTRLPVYARVLDDLVRRGVVTASSVELAAAAGVEPAQLRRDLSHLGSYGKRGVGYDVAELRVMAESLDPPIIWHDLAPLELLLEAGDAHLEGVARCQRFRLQRRPRPDLAAARAAGEIGVRFVIGHDLDIAALTAEALMNRTPWQLWDQPTGLPAEGGPEPTGAPKTAPIPTSTTAR